MLVAANPTREAPTVTAVPDLVKRVRRRNPKRRLTDQRRDLGFCGRRIERRRRDPWHVSDPEGDLHEVGMVGASFPDRRDAGIDL